MLQCGLFNGWGRGRLAPAQQGSDSSQEFSQPEGLSHIVVRADVQTDHAINLGSSRGEDQHRSGEPVLPDLPTHLEPVNIRKSQVKHDHVQRVGAGPSDGRLPSRLVVHVISLALQGAGQG